MDFNYYYNEVMHHEWVMSNSRGGYSMGCGNLVNKRKYNGLLIASDKNLRRTHIVQAQEVKVRWRSKEVYLDSNNYADCIYPNGYEHIVKTWFYPYPTFLYSSIPKSDEFIVVKSIKLHPSKNIVKVTFTNHCSTAVELEVRPKFSLRDHHSVNDPNIWDNTVTIFIKDNDRSATFNRLDTKAEGHIAVSEGVISDSKLIFRNVYYPADATRGYDAMESVISPCVITMTLEKNGSAYILYSDEHIDNIEKASKEIDRRYSKSIYPKDHPEKCGTDYSLGNVSFDDDNLYALKKYPDILSDIYDSFILKDDMIAGFPWFSAWGRDTMISMKGLLYQKKFDLYLKILDKYGKQLQKGILPNVIGEGGVGTNHNSVDASLWFTVRLYDVWDHIEDEKTKIKMFGYLSEIIGNYGFNKLLPFFCDEDGLIEIKPGDAGLTWMDAKVYGNPVTPRYGKPVEINALWYNALKTFDLAAKDLKKKSFKLKYIKFSMKDVSELIEKIESSSQIFVVNGHLSDRIENGYQIDEYRPNVMIATSLPFLLWDDEIIRNCFSIAHDELLTPYGLRTLTPRNSSFKKKYIGSQTQLDMAYHQGTVWAWLLGPFIETFVLINKKKMKKAELKSCIDSFIGRFKQGILKGHISSVAEVWDGSDPHFPKGCPAQAWSVAALMTAEHIFDKIEKPEVKK